MKKHYAIANAPDNTKNWVSKKCYANAKAKEDANAKANTTAKAKANTSTKAKAKAKATANANARIWIYIYQLMLLLMLSFVFHIPYEINVDPSQKILGNFFLLLFGSEHLVASEHRRPPIRAA